VSNDSLVVNIWQDVKRRGRGPLLRLIQYLVDDKPTNASVRIAGPWADKKPVTNN
jgi:hypothetical protein